MRSPSCAALLGEFYGLTKDAAFVGRYAGFQMELEDHQVPGLGGSRINCVRSKWSVQRSPAQAEPVEPLSADHGIRA